MRNAFAPPKSYAQVKREFSFFFFFFGFCCSPLFSSLFLSYAHILRSLHHLELFFCLPTGSSRSCSLPGDYLATKRRSVAKFLDFDLNVQTSSFFRSFNSLHFDFVKKKKRHRFVTHVEFVSKTNTSTTTNGYFIQSWIWKTKLKSKMKIQKLPPVRCIHNAQ